MPGLLLPHLEHQWDTLVNLLSIPARGQLRATRGAWHGTSEAATVRNRTIGGFDERESGCRNLPGRGFGRQPIRLRLHSPEHPPQPLSHPVAITDAFLFVLVHLRPVPAHALQGSLAKALPGFPHSLERRRP